MFLFAIVCYKNDERNRWQYLESTLEAAYSKLRKWFVLQFGVQALFWHWRRTGDKNREAYVNKWLHSMLGSCATILFLENPETLPAIELTAFCLSWWCPVCLKQAACRSANPYPHCIGWLTQRGVGIKAGRRLELYSHITEFVWLVMSMATRKACCSNWR